MKRETEKRLDAIELKGPDWTRHLETIDCDYLGDCDPPDDDVWEEIFFDKFVTAIRHRATGEIRGYCRDRRSHAEMEADGGNLEFL